MPSMLIHNERPLTMNTVHILIAATLTASAVLLPSAGAFAATPDPGPAFGRHVSECARTMGFSAIHNPGMHQGKSGWDGTSCVMPPP